MHGSKSRKESLKNKNRFKNIKNTKIEQFKVFCWTTSKKSDTIMQSPKCKKIKE